MSKKLSGAQRRKLHKESELANCALLNKVPKLTNFFKTNTNTTQNVTVAESSLSAPSCSSSSQSTTSLETQDTVPVPSHPYENVTSGNEHEHDDDNESVIELLTNTETDNNFISKLEQLPVITSDPATWPAQIMQIKRDELVLKGPSEYCKNDHEYPKNFENRHFSNEFRYRFLENGEKISRRWLIYSEKSDSVYCFCCRLFSSSSKSSFGQVMGFNNWKNLADRLKSHELSPDHFKNMATWFEAEKRMNKDASINQCIMKQIESEAERSEKVLQRLVAITLFLAEHNLAFRGSSSKIFTNNNGNFLGLVELLGKFDSVLMEHLRRITEKETQFHLLSVSIQNELINILGDAVKQSILTKIKDARYFSVILDCTPDISHKEQVSLTIRYVTEDDDGNIQVEESFIAYRVAKETTGQALADLLLTEIEECGLNMVNCRGQGYDNGANMAGVHKGVQAGVLDKFPLATFIPCGCHSLNLVIADGAKSSVKSTSLFGILQRLFTIFSSSTKRWCVISDHTKTLTLKQVCETRWEARISAIQAVRYQYVEVRDALVELGDKIDDPQTASEAQSLTNQMEDFSFIVVLILWNEILFEVNLISKSIQGKEVDISVCSEKFDKCLEFLNRFRENGYVDVVISAKEIAAELDIEPVFPKKRIRKRKRIFLYESSEEVQSSPEETFKREVFYPLVDNVLNSLKKRSTALKEHQQVWGFLGNVAQLPEKEDLKQICLNLERHLTDKTTKVSDINGSELYHELLHVSSILDHGKKKVTPKEVLCMIKNTNSKDLFTNLWVALRVLLTIPVTVASAERSFSKLKLIKTYLRSTMAQERLNSLAILAIENNTAKKLDFRDILSTFTRAKVRRMPFNV